MMRLLDAARRLGLNRRDMKTTTSRLEEVAKIGLPNDSANQLSPLERKLAEKQTTEPPMDAVAGSEYLGDDQRKAEPADAVVISENSRREGDTSTTSDRVVIPGNLLAYLVRTQTILCKGREYPATFAKRVAKLMEDGAQLGNLKGWVNDAGRAHEELMNLDQCGINDSSILDNMKEGIFPTTLMSGLPYQTRRFVLAMRMLDFRLTIRDKIPAVNDGNVNAAVEALARTLNRAQAERSDDVLWLLRLRLSDRDENNDVRTIFRPVLTQEQLTVLESALWEQRAQTVNARTGRVIREELQTSSEPTETVIRNVSAVLGAIADRRARLAELELPPTEWVLEERRRTQVDGTRILLDENDAMGPTVPTECLAFLTEVRPPCIYTEIDPTKGTPTALPTNVVQEYARELNQKTLLSRQKEGHQCELLTGNLTPEIANALTPGAFRILARIRLLQAHERFVKAMTSTPPTISLETPIQSWEIYLGRNENAAIAQLLATLRESWRRAMFPEYSRQGLSEDGIRYRGFETEVQTLARTDEIAKTLAKDPTAFGAQREPPETLGSRLAATGTPWTEPK